MTVDHLLVETPDPDSALSLVERLTNLHCELLPGEGDRCHVQIELGNGHRRPVDAVLDAVAQWLTGTGIDAAKVKLGDQTYLAERQPPSPRRLREAKTYPRDIPLEQRRN